MAALAYLDSWISELESSDVKRTDPSTSIVEANSLAFLDEFINELTPCAKARAARKEKGKEKDKGKGGPGGPGKKPSKAVDAGPDFTELHAGHLEMRVGVIVEAWEHPDSEKLWCERIDVGESEVREIASGLRAFYKLEDMKGARVVVLCNLKIKKLGGFPSNGMVMCASNTAHDEVKFVVPPEGAPVGSLVTFAGLAATPATSAQEKKRKIFEAVAPHLETGPGGVCTFKGVAFEVDGFGACTSPVPEGYHIS